MYSNLNRSNSIIQDDLDIIEDSAGIFGVAVRSNYIRTDHTSTGRNNVRVVDDTVRVCDTGIAIAPYTQSNQSRPSSAVFLVRPSTSMSARIVSVSVDGVVFGPTGLFLWRVVQFRRHP